MQVAIDGEEETDGHTSVMGGGIAGVKDSARAEATHHLVDHRHADGVAWEGSGQETVDHRGLAYDPPFLTRRCGLQERATEKRGCRRDWRGSR